MPFFAAKLYDNLTSVKGVNKEFEEIASFVCGLQNKGNILDIGTGPGRLLYEINKKNSQIALYGLDISSSMLELARKNLRTLKNTDLRLGNIVQTEYKDDFFDCVIASGSFYNWDSPIRGLNEIFRILKPGKTAYIFDAHKDYDKGLLNLRLKANLKQYNFIRRSISKFFLTKQLKMAYSIPEIDNILKQSKFIRTFNIRRINLGDLPV